VKSNLNNEAGDKPEFKIMGPWGLIGLPVNC